MAYAAAVTEVCRSAAATSAARLTRVAEWRDVADDKGKIKLVHTCEPSETKEHIRKHVRRPSRNKAIQRPEHQRGLGGA